MSESSRFLADERGALSVDRVFLAAAALLILGMASYELVSTGVGSLVSTVDPGVAAFTAELESETRQAQR